MRGMIRAMAGARRRSMTNAVTGGMGGGGDTEITPSLTASITSGPAPLGVVFDAVASSSTRLSDNFRQMVYSFNYGDSGAGTWTYGNSANSSKNSDQGGPIAAHVFETPGTYTVTLTCQDGTGSNTTTVTITVQDPDTVFSGTNTICVNDTGTSDGLGPAGCTYQSTMPSAATMNGKRVLLRRGSSTERTIPNITNGSGHAFYVGAYGTGADPLIAGGDVVIYNQSTSVFTNLQPAKNTKFNIQGGHALFHRCANRAYSGSPMTDLPYGADAVDLGYTNTANLILSECTVDLNDYAASYGFFGKIGPSSAIVGNNFRDPGYHDVRVTQSYKLFVAHNSLEGSTATSTYHALKSHAGNTTVFTPGSGGSAFATRYLVVANNQFGRSGSINGYLVQICPQNSSSAEGIEDVMVENNVCGDSGATDMAFGGRRITYIGNTRLGGGSATTTTGYNMAATPTWDGPYYTSRS